MISGTDMKLTKIPSILHNLDLSSDLGLSEKIVCKEGIVVLAQVLDDRNATARIEFSTGRIGVLVRDDIIPGVLGKRRATRRLSGDVPKTLKVGDTLHWLSDGGVLGEIKGVDPRSGKALPLKVLGGLTQKGQSLSLIDLVTEEPNLLDNSAPIIAVVGTCMDTGKTTAICQIVKYFKQKGLKIAYGKLTGVAFQGDLLKVNDFGADKVLSFVDGGLPSTCGEPSQVTKVTIGLLKKLNQINPDLIIAEFGASILGEYNVTTLLGNPEIRHHIKATVLAASDTVAAWGGKEILDQYGITISLITGPVANNLTEAYLVEEKLGIVTESNLDLMSRGMKVLEEAIGSISLIQETSPQ
jgi:hypothetical protein